MRRNDEPSLAAAEPREILERLHVFRPAAEIQQQNMTAFDRSLEARDEDDAPLCGVRPKRSDVQLPLVQCDRDRLIAELGRVIDEVGDGMRDVVDRIVRRVCVKFDLQHRSGSPSGFAPARYVRFHAARSSAPARQCACGLTRSTLAPGTGRPRPLNPLVVRPHAIHSSDIRVSSIRRISS